MPLGLTGFNSCENCGHLFQTSGKENISRMHILAHYETADPHRRVADSKSNFFESVLDYLSARLQKYPNSQFPD